MLKYSLAKIIKLHLNAKRCLPKPFPGKFPTHIYIKTQVGEKEFTEYIGKPFQQLGPAAAAAYADWQKGPQIVHLIEFDRGSKIFEWGGTKFCQTIFNLRLFQIYHPMCSAMPLATSTADWFNSPWVVIRKPVPFYLSKHMEPLAPGVQSSVERAYKALLNEAPKTKKSPLTRE